MKKLFFLFILTIFALTSTFSQKEPVSTLSNTVKSSKSNSQDRKGWDGTIKGRTIHVEVDVEGNDIFYLPTKPAIALVYNPASNLYEVKAPRDVATGQSSGKRMHKPLTITKYLNKASPILMKIDDSGDIDISSLAAGRYQVNSQRSGFTFTLDAQGIITSYDLAVNKKL